MSLYLLTNAVLPSTLPSHSYQSNQERALLDVKSSAEVILRLVRRPPRQFHTLADKTEDDFTVIMDARIGVFRPASMEQWGEIPGIVGHRTSPVWLRRRFKGCYWRQNTSRRQQGVINSISSTSSSSSSSSSSSARVMPSNS